MSLIDINIDKNITIKGESLLDDVPEDKKKYAIVQYKKILSDMKMVILNNSKLKYFGIIAYGLDRFIFLKEQNALFKNKQALAYTDGKGIYYLANGNNTLSEVLSITIHEVAHVILEHIQRGKGKHRIAWNLACDHVVNTIIYELAKEKETGNGMNYISWIDNYFFVEEVYKQEPTIHAEKMYEYICDEIKSNRYKITVYTGSGPGSGSSNGSGNSDGGNPTMVEVEDTKTGKKWNMVLDTDVSDKSYEEQDELMDILDELANKAKSIYNSPGGHHKGNLPGNVASMLEEAFKVKIPWDVIYDDALKYESQNCSDLSWTWKNPYVRNVRVPGEMYDTTPSAMIVVFDTSGSVSDDSLKKFIGITLSGASLYDQLILIQHDHDISKIDIIEDLESKSEEDIFQVISRIVGRGGTSHKEVFDKIEELSSDVLISTIVFMTDYYSDVEHIYKDYTFMKEFKTIWTICSCGGFKDDHPTIQLDDEYEFLQINIEDFE